jgi:integrase/recombinase XerD
MGNTVAGVEQERVTTGSWKADASSLYAPNGCRKYLNHAERQRALGAMTLLKFDQSLFALTLAWTGARVSEVLALTPASFQLECGTVAIQTLKRRKHCVREVPIPPALMTELDRHFGIARAQGDLESAHRRLWPWCRSTAWRIIKRVMHQSGIIGNQACPRGLRHAFGVGTLQASVPITLVQRWLGHARLSTTAIYVDASGPEELAFAARFWLAAA